MKIIYNKSTTVETAFESMQIGQGFIDHDGDICVKTIRGANYYAYCFSDGMLYAEDCFRCAKFKLVELELHVQDKTS